MKKIKTGPIKLLLEMVLVVGCVDAVVTRVFPALAQGQPALAQASLHAGLLTLWAGPLIYWRCMVFAQALRTQNTGRAHTPHVLSFGQAVAWTAAAQALGVLLTVASVVYVQRNLDDEAKVRFDRGVERLEAEVNLRFKDPVYGLDGLRASLAALGAATGQRQWSRAAFRAYVEANQLRSKFPGIRGFGFIEQVLRQDLATFTQRVRKDAAPNFTVRSSGQAMDLLVIKNIWSASA